MITGRATIGFRAVAAQIGLATYVETGYKFGFGGFSLTHVLKVATEFTTKSYKPSKKGAAQAVEDLTVLLECGATLEQLGGDR